MSRFNRFFGDVNMSPARVLAFAVGTAVLTVVFNICPFFADSSLQDVAVYLDFWILCAVFVISNCGSAKEASLKCFVFFLVSQPLIYLLEVPFVADGFGIFRYYDYWFKMTLLTIPGAAIAFLIKRGDWLGTAVLSVANAYYAYQSVYYLRRVIIDPPHHALSFAFCMLMIVLFVQIFVREKKQRLAAYTLAAAVFAAAVYVEGLPLKPDVQEYDIAPGSWTVEYSQPGIADVLVDESGHVVVSSGKEGSTMIYLTDQDGNVLEWNASVSGGKLWLFMFDE